MLDRLRSFTLAKLEAALRTVSDIETAEFPREDSRSALEAIRRALTDHCDSLNRLSPESNQLVVTAACRESLQAVESYLPLLGLILRSTNVRNAFEVHGPLLRLARWLVGVDTKLVVSSEWEFSPFEYNAIPPLPDFVLIGLPASESSNGLLLPLSGHELGHAVWAKRGLRAVFTPDIRQAILDAIAMRWPEFSKAYPNLPRESLDDLEGQAAWGTSF